MAVVIRLARYGAKKRPYYHIVVTDSREARNSGNILEVIGKYNPMAAKRFSGSHNIGRRQGKILDVQGCASVGQSL